MQIWQVQYLCDWKKKAGLFGKALLMMQVKDTSMPVWTSRYRTVLTKGANNKFSKAPEGAKTPTLFKEFQEVGDSSISATLQGRPSSSIGRVCDPYRNIYKYLAAVAKGLSLTCCYLLLFIPISPHLISCHLSSLSVKKKYLKTNKTDNNPTWWPSKLVG